MRVFRSIVLWTALLAAALTCDSAFAAAEQAQVAIGPQVLTLPEIAAKLSANGPRVRCAASLQNRAAFVYLKSRAWQQACDLLAAGLDVQFRESASEQEKGVLLMERSPEVSAREKRWQRRLENALRGSLRRQYAQVEKSLRQPDATLEEQQSRLGEQINALLESSRGEMTPRVRQLQDQRAPLVAAQLSRKYPSAS